MIDEKYLELIQADVDGELPDADRAELSRFLLGSPEGRAVRDELRGISRALSGVPSVEPPAELRASVLRSVRLPTSAAGVGRGFGRFPPMLRYAAVFAGGLIVSGIAFEAFDKGGPGLEISQVAGTMASRDPALAEAPVDTLQVSLEQVHGTVKLFRSAELRVIEFDLTAQQPVDVVVVHDGEEARFSGLGQGGAGRGQRYALVLDGSGQAGAPIEVKFFVSGSLVHEDVLGSRAPGGS